MRETTGKLISLEEKHDFGVSHFDVTTARLRVYPDYFRSSPDKVTALCDFVVPVEDNKRYRCIAFYDVYVA